jgi:hypothetical protein
VTLYPNTDHSYSILYPAHAIAGTPLAYEIGTVSNYNEVCPSLQANRTSASLVRHKMLARFGFLSRTCGLFPATAMRCLGGAFQHRRRPLRTASLGAFRGTAGGAGSTPVSLSVQRLRALVAPYRQLQPAWPADAAAPQPGGLQPGGADPPDPHGLCCRDPALHITGPRCCLARLLMYARRPIDGPSLRRSMATCDSFWRSSAVVRILS